MTSTNKLILNYTKSVTPVLVAAMAFFVICGAIGAVLGYSTGIGPFAANNWLATNSIVVKNHHPLQCAVDAFVAIGAFGAVGVTPIFLMLIAASEKGKTYPLILKMVVATAGGIAWAVIVCALSCMLYFGRL